MKTEKQAKLETLIGFAHSLLEMLEELQADEENTVQHKYAKEPSATTTEVCLRTGKRYGWKPLHQWCKDNFYKPTKVAHYAITINKYPATAWKEVYNVDIVSELGL